MSFAISVALAVCMVAVAAFPNEPREARAAIALAAFAGLPEIQHGHAPAKDYIVIEILNPVIHYFAAETHQEAAVPVPAVTKQEPLAPADAEQEAHAPAVIEQEALAPAVIEQEALAPAVTEQEAPATAVTEQEEGK